MGVPLYLIFTEKLWYKNQLSIDDAFQITLDELKSILNNYGKDTMYSTGVKLGGQKYM